jgi:MbtH protein
VNECLLDKSDFCQLYSSVEPITEPITEPRQAHKTSFVEKEIFAMSWDEQEDKTIYKVVVNHEEQYSIWVADRENPPGWRDSGKQGLKSECLAYIKEVWTDMRPLSLRKT